MSAILLFVTIFTISVSTELSLSGRLATSGLPLVAMACVPKMNRKFRALAGWMGAALTSSGFFLSIIVNIANAPTAIRPEEYARFTLNSIIMEEDGIALAFRILPLIGGITQRELVGLGPILQQEYARMREHSGNLPTPLVSSYLGLQALSSDLLVFRSAQRTNQALVFLHGFAGNWTLLCALVAQAANPLGIDTFCPSIGPTGFWASSSGKAIIESNLNALKGAGYTKIYLAGLSNGAIGASALAETFKDKLSGLILLFGLYPGASRAELPTLIIYGNQDERFTPDVIKDLIKTEQWKPGTMQAEAVEGDHFALLKEKRAVQEILIRWLKSPTEDLGS